MAPNVNMALAFGPTLLIPLMLFGGLFLNNSTIPVYLEWLKYLSWFMYSNEALLVNQWEGVTGIQVTRIKTFWKNQSTNYFPKGLMGMTQTGEDVLNSLHFSGDNFTRDLYLLAVLCIAFRILAFIALLLKTYRKK